MRIYTHLPSTLTPMTILHEMRIYTLLPSTFDTYDYFARNAYLYTSMHIYTHLPSTLTPRTNFARNAYLHASMSIYMHLHLTFGFTSEVSLSQDGAVGARVIQASTHVRRGVGVLSNSSPQPVTWLLPRLVVISCLREEDLHGTILSLQSFWHHSQLSSPSSLCILPRIVPQVDNELRSSHVT
jgi:hypothetical protein